jgi:hypothetical protein
MKLSSVQYLHYSILVGEQSLNLQFPAYHYGARSALIYTSDELYKLVKL